MSENAGSLTLQVQRVGSDHAVCVDVRILAATNADLGRSLESLLDRHAGDTALRASAAAAGLAEQRGQARRVRARRSLQALLQRGGWRAWYSLREAIAPPRPRLS